MRDLKVCLWAAPKLRIICSSRCSPSRKFQRCFVSAGKIKKKFSAIARKPGWRKIPEITQEFSVVVASASGRVVCDFLIYYLLSFEDMRKEKKFLGLCLSDGQWERKIIYFWRDFFSAALLFFFPALASFLSCLANHKSFTWNAEAEKKETFFEREKEKKIFNFFLLYFFFVFWKPFSIIFIHVVYLGWFYGMTRIWDAFSWRFVGKEVLIGNAWRTHRRFLEYESSWNPWNLTFCILLDETRPGALEGW